MGIERKILEIEIISSSDEIDEDWETFCARINTEIRKVYTFGNLTKVSLTNDWEDGTKFSITHYRPETYDEYHNRQRREQSEKRHQEEHNQRNRRAEYERLKREFEPGG